MMDDIFQIMLSRIEDLSRLAEKERRSRVDAESRVRSIEEPGFVPVAMVDDLLSALCEGKKMYATRAYCTLTGVRLQQAKDSVDKFCAAIESRRAE